MRTKVKRTVHEMRDDETRNLKRIAKKLNTAAQQLQLAAYYREDGAYQSGDQCFNRAGVLVNEAVAAFDSKKWRVLK